MSEVEREPTVEEVLDSQIEAVKNFSPEQILAPEKREQIVESITNGLDLIASTIKEDAESSGFTYDEYAVFMHWSMRDFARTVLTSPPLPPQAFQMEEPSLEVMVADDHNWWEELSAEQKVALWKILKEDFGVDLDSEPETTKVMGHEGVDEGWVVKSEKVIVVPAAEDWPENKFKPALVSHPDHGLGLTCFVVG